MNPDNYNLCKEIEHKTWRIDDDLFIRVGDHLDLVRSYRNQIADLKKQLFKPQLIGLCGLAGAGKTTVAKILMEEHNFIRTRFAEPIKAMIRALLVYCDFDHEMIEKMVDGNLKEQVIPELNFKSARYALQTIGTEWGREYLGENIWVDLTMRNVRQLMDQAATSVVIDDVRFTNESAAIRKAGGRVFRVMREHDPIPDCGHKSEKQLIEFDGCILNNGTLEDLRIQIKQNL